MLIVNADDWGKNELTTNNCLLCFKMDRITSVSAMVFMSDSERAANLALQHNIDVGLHLNFTQQFSGNSGSIKLKEFHESIASFLSKNKYALLLYNPLLKKKFEYVYKSQLEEYVRLYRKIPSHINGHQHMHLSTNILIDHIIPAGFKVRRNFTFDRGEKSLLNRGYRKIIDGWLTKRYIMTDFFYCLSSALQFGNLQRIIKISQSSNVELMVHPERPDECKCLTSNTYLSMVSKTKKGSYKNLTTIMD